MATSQYESTIVVTGGTTGLGTGAAVALARHFPNYHIIIASRSNAEAADANINKTLNQSNTKFLKLDLSSTDSIRAFVSDITSKYPPVSHLLMNAGLQFPGPVDFFDSSLEKTFAVNHAGHALLFYLLLPRLTQDCHIVITASGTHDPAQKTGIPTKDYTNYASESRPDPKTANKDGRERYSTSKLLNVMWTYALDRHLKSSSRNTMVVNAFDPGLMPGTGLARAYPAPLRFVWNHVMPRLIWLMRIMVSPNIHTTKESGESLARLAIGEEDEVKGVSGKYFEGQHTIKSSVRSYNEHLQEDLYEGTIKELASSEAEAAKWKSFQA